jgi:hypothetical protein
MTIDLQDDLSIFSLDIVTQVIFGQFTLGLKALNFDKATVLAAAIDYTSNLMRLWTDLGIFVYAHWDRKFNVTKL